MKHSNIPRDWRPHWTTSSYYWRISCTFVDYCFQLSEVRNVSIIPLFPSSSWSATTAICFRIYKLSVLVFFGTWIMQKTFKISILIDSNIWWIELMQIKLIILLVKLKVIVRCILSLLFSKSVVHPDRIKLSNKLNVLIMNLI